jgi:hypothetical protein
MSRIDEKTLAERFEDDSRITRAMNRAAELARLRREMWQKFRAAVGEAGAQRSRGPAAGGAAREEAR